MNVPFMLNAQKLDVTMRLGKREDIEELKYESEESLLRCWRAYKCSRGWNIPRSGFTFLVGTALDLSHMKMRKVVQDLIWVTVLTMLIVNNKALLQGYQQKITCIYESTASSVKNTVEDVLTNITVSVNGIVTELKHADYVDTIKVTKREMDFNSP